MENFSMKKLINSAKCAKKENTVKITKCRGCFSEEIETVIDLGVQPWGNDFRHKDFKGVIPTYPLAIDFCHRCALLSLNYTVPKEVMFSDHTYLSGVTKTLTDYFHETSLESLKILSDGRRKQSKKIKVLDIGSNDGAQLEQFKRLGCEVMGVESSHNIAIIAQNKGIPTINAYFNNALVESIDERFDLINASGVFFHLEELHSAIKAIKRLLLEKGLFVVQFIYLKKLIENGCFDQIHHEHLVYYLFTTLNGLLEPYGLEIFDGELKDIHGGSGVAYIGYQGKRKISTRLLNLYAEEKDCGFLTIEIYQRFMADIEIFKRENREYIEKQISKGKVIYGMGAPVKGNTLLNYLGYSTREIKCLVEINPLRKDRVAPVSGIPVLLEDQLEAQPDLYYCLAWNFKKSILTNYNHLKESGTEFYFPFNYEFDREHRDLRVVNYETSNKIEKHDKILITGASGLVGHALIKCLSRYGFDNIFPISSKDCDLCEKDKVEELFKKIEPDYVFHLAAKNLGIGGNSQYQADVLFENVQMNINVAECSRKVGVQKIVAMGSGCIYPDLGQKELSEGQIWIGEPHDSQAGYAHSKRLMLSHLRAINAQYGMDYVFAISGNIYGPHGIFNLDTAPAAPALIHKFVLADRKKNPVTVWGTGESVRDFSHSDDIAKALYLCMKDLSGPINIGSGHKHKIKDIVNILSEIYEHKLEINFDVTKPDGQLVRYYNLDKLLATGFSPEFDLKSGIRKTHQWLVENLDKARL